MHICLKIYYIVLMFQLEDSGVILLIEGMHAWHSGRMKSGPEGSRDSRTYLHLQYKGAMTHPTHATSKGTNPHLFHLLVWLQNPCVHSSLSSVLCKLLCKMVLTENCYVLTWNKGLCQHWIKGCSSYRRLLRFSSVVIAFPISYIAQGFPVYQEVFPILNWIKQ